MAWVASHVKTESGRKPYVPNDTMVIEIQYVLKIFQLKMQPQIYIWGSLNKL